MKGRREKIVGLAEAVREIESGSTIALGGLSFFNAPMALVRELIRQRKRELTVITSAVAGLAVDVLIGAGCVRRLLSPYVGLEEFGAAPAFRRAVEQGEIEICEVGEAFLAFGLKAGAAGAPFFALPRRLAGTDLVRVNGEYRFTTDPFTGEEVLCVPALRPDWALVHAQQSDPFGNARHLGSAYMDPLIARAARRVLLSCDEVISLEETRREPRRTTLPGILVDRVVPVPRGAHPAASEPLYDVDREHLRVYLQLCATPEGTARYVEEFICSGDEETYLRKVALKPDVSAEYREQGSEEEAPVSTAERLAVLCSRLVKDGDLVGVGTGCWEVAAGMRLAQLRHAPHLSFTMGGTGAVNPDLEEILPSVNSARALERAEAVLGLEELLDLELQGAFDVMFLSGLQMDRWGNVNLVGVGSWPRMKVRGPGSVGLEFAPCVRRRVAFFRRHTRRVFPERVDFISAPGPSSEGEELWVLTNLAVMTLEEPGRMRLVSCHPGVTVEQVRENTGFELVIPDRVPETEPPTPEELRLLRARVDRRGFLRRMG